LETDKDLDYYGTDKLDKSQYFNILEKVTDDRNTYKEVINILSDKYNIGNDEILNIIDDIKDNSKNLNIERV
jgi:3-methyladenine DNA glycosylase AlkC